MSHIAHLNLPATTVADLKVGQLLRNDDKQGKVFGRIVKISGRGVWRRLLVDTDDKHDPPAPLAQP